MHKQNQAGVSSVALAIVFGILFVGAAGFGGWAFMGRQDYKNNSDAKSAQAVAAAEKIQADQLQKKFDEDYKNPNKAYKGPIAFGTVSFNYPKTWSTYLDDTNSAEPINSFFYPDIVPSTQSGSAYALRVELQNISYSQVLGQYDAQIKQGKIKAVAYIPPKMVGVANVQPGTRLDGIISQSSTGVHTGAMVIMQVRDKTLKIYTESPDFLKDYNNIVLPSLTYVP
jgi:hypothetical protein